MTRCAFAVFALFAAVAPQHLAASPSSGTQQAEMHVAANVAADVLRAHEAGTSMGDVLPAPRPDPFHVLIQVALQSPDAATRKATLTAIATHYGDSPWTASAALWAEYWATAPDEAVAAEREFVAQFMALADKDSAAALASIPSDAGPVTYSVGRCLLALARARGLGREPKLAEALSSQLATFGAAAGWHFLGASSHMLRGMALTRLRRRHEAVLAYRAAGDAARLGGFPRLVTSAMQFETITLARLGTVERYAATLRLVEIDEHGGEALRDERAQLWLASAELDMGALDTAFARLNDLIPSAHARKDELTERLGRELLLQAMLKKGLFAQALHAVEELLQDPGSTPHLRRRRYLHVASVCQALGFDKRALALSLKALKEVEPQGGLRVPRYAKDGIRLSSLLRSLGQPEEGDAVLARTIQTLREAKLPMQLGNALQTHAANALASGDVDAARAAAAETTALWTRASPRQRALAALLQGEVELRAEALDAAWAFFDIAFALAQRIEPEPRLRGRLMALMGDTLDQQGHPERALPYLRGATDLLARFAHGLGDRSGLHVRGRVDRVARRGFEVAAKLDRWQDAWWFREAGHALLLADTIQNSDASIRNRASAQDRVDEQDAMRALTEAQTKFVLLQARGEASAEALDATRRAVADAHGTYNTVAARAGREAPHEMLGPRVPPVPLATFQETLRGDDAALAYYVAGDTLFGLAVRRDAVQGQALGPAARFLEDVTAWRDLVTTPDGPASKVGLRLYKGLVAPFAGLLQGARSLCVLPDQAVSYLPFEALVTDRTGARPRYLLEDFDRVSYAPSAAVTQSLRAVAAARKPGKGLLALGDPLYPKAASAPLLAMGERAIQLGRLPGSAEEVRQIAAVYPKPEQTVLLGVDASLSAWESAALRADDQPWRAVHLACHGYVDTNRPRLSGLVFAGGDVLNVERIHTLRIPAELVVLSACNTGGGALHRGEGVLGLTRGFLQAGTPQVVVSNWRVADRSTAVFMTHFHRAMLRDGKRSGVALQRAKIALLKTQYAHPYYWAPFVLWGLPDP